MEGPLVESAAINHSATLQLVCQHTSDLEAKIDSPIALHEILKSSFLELDPTLT
jgi:hypothetical protein